MLNPRTCATKLLQLGCLGYLVAALIYTTNYAVVVPLSSLVLSLFDYGFAIPKVLPLGTDTPPQPRVDLVAQAQRATFAQHKDTHAKDNSLWDFETSDYMLDWMEPLDTDQLGRQNPLPIREATFLSKAFAQSMHPTKIIPFYYKARAPVDAEDVTITTLVTSNRYKVLKQLVERYQGPISVTIHIPMPSRNLNPPSHTATRHFINAVKDLEALYASSPHFATYVDVHLALSPSSGTGSSGTNDPDTGTTEGARQFNVWRNIARLFSRTEFVMMLDVDFAICTDWRSAIRNNLGRYNNDYKGSRLGLGLDEAAARDTRNTSIIDVEVIKKLRDGKIALVLPAFEYVRQEDGIDQSTFPRDKESLMRLTSGPTPKIAAFHASWAPGHNSTDYAKYFSIPPGLEEVYEVTQYQSAYEPYVIMSKRVTWCDERFTGYGGNKAACLFELYLSGVTFYVMSDHFLIHQSHKYEEEARREERKYNRKLYADFKEEACLRYLYRFKSTGQLHTPIASNVIGECKKLKSVAKAAPELLGEEVGL